MAAAEMSRDAHSTAHLTSPKTTTKEKLKYSLQRTVTALSTTTVEPCVTIYMISTSMSSFAVKAMNQEKACRTNLAYDDAVCDRIAAGDAWDLKAQQALVQTLVSRVSSWEMPLQTALPAILVLMVGAWSDRTRRRKVCILAPLIGEMVTSVCMMLATWKMREWSLETTALMEALPPALTGGWLSFFMGVYSYLTDKTTVEERTFRLGIVAVCASLGSPAGTALGGILLPSMGYYGIFALLLSLHTVSFFYGIMCIRDVPVEHQEPTRDLDCFAKYFVAPLRDTFRVLTKRRLGSRRMQIFAALLLYCILVGPLYGDAQASFNYTAFKFNFTLLEFSLYTTCNTLAGLGGTLLCITVLIRLMRIEDSTVGMLACASRIAACLVFALAPTRRWFYMAPAVNIFGYTGLMAVRSMSSKLVAKDEVGKLSSMLAVFEGLAPSVYVPIANTIYVASQWTLPGAFYLFDASITVVALGLFAMCYMVQKTEKKIEEQQIHSQSEVPETYTRYNHGMDMSTE